MLTLFAGGGHREAMAVCIVYRTHGFVDKPADTSHCDARVRESVFENSYIAWMDDGSNRRSQALSLVRGRYLLSIDPIFTHASGIIGGRFAEYASEKQSIKTVMANVDQPAGGFECAQTPSDAIVVSEDLSLWNLYADNSKVGNGCVFPSGGRPVWFGSVFSGPGSESDYSITLTYSSNEVDSFPNKDSVELRRIFGEVKEMLKTLQLKPPIVISGIDPGSSSPGARVTIHGSGFHLFNRNVEVRFKEFPNNPMPPPVIASDGNSLTFDVPTSINTISCPPGRIDVHEWCVPTPPNHSDVNDCPPKPGGPEECLWDTDASRYISTLGHDGRSRQRFHLPDNHFSGRD